MYQASGKTAVKLLKEHGSVEALYEAMDTLKASKMKEKLVANEEQAIMSKKLATIYTDAPITISLDDLAYNGPKEDELISVWRELGFKSLLDKSDFIVHEEEQAPFDYDLVQEIQPEDLQDVMAVHVELENEHYHTCQQLGIALSNGTKTQYIPFDKAAKSDTLRRWLEDATKIKYMSDSKAAQASLKRAGIQLAGVDFDLLLASYINNPALSGDDIATLARELGYYDVQADEAVYGKGAKRAIPDLDQLAQHVSRKAFAVWSLQPKLEALLKENEQFDLYKT